MQKEPGHLSEAEMEIMREVWAMDEPITVTRLLNIFAPRREWKKSTLSTMLDRLITKGYLQKSFDGLMNVYTSLISEEMYKQHETLTFLETVHNGNLKSFVASLVDAKDINADDIVEISTWFNEKSKGKL